jgi:cholinesterase
MKIFQAGLWGSLLALCVEAKLEKRAWTIGQAVDTTSGRIIGHPASVRTGVSEYLGIRYAKAATGSLRFAAPQPYTSTAIYNASSFSADCPSNLASAADFVAIADQIANPQGFEVLGQFGQTGNTQSEDCLSINVWTKPQAGEAKKAVMVWIYGGGRYSCTSPGLY